MRPPTLRIHKTGQYMVRYAGRDHYLGHDKRRADEQFLTHLDKWREWRESKAEARNIRHQFKRVPGVVELINMFVDAKKTERGDACAAYYKKHLRYFNQIYGKQDIDVIGPRHLNAVKIELLRQGYAPKTINHDLTAIRVMLNWASALELGPNINLKGVKNLPLGPVEHVAVSVKEVRAAIRSAPPDVKEWMAINYLALLRPSEVVRVVHKQGEWIQKGVFRLDRGKMDERASIKRHCIFSAEALKWLKKCKPRWDLAESYSKLVRDHWAHGPKVLQKSAAAHLVQSPGVEPADVELLLGHVTGRLPVTYYLPAFAKLRVKVARLSL